MKTTTKKTDATYRNIAIMLVKSMPVEGEIFGDKVTEYHAIIESLPQTAKIALRSAYIFSRKVPREEREDLFQDIALAILRAQTKDEKLAYAIARCDWRDWWKKYKNRSHYSLNTVIDDNEGNSAELIELLVGETEFERKQCDKLDTQAIWNQLPAKIKPIIMNKLIGQPLNSTERSHLKRWITRTGYQLLMT